MEKIKTCKSFAVGIGSVFSIAPFMSKSKLYELTPYETENTGVYKYWSNVGGYIQNAFTQVRDNDDQ